VSEVGTAGAWPTLTDQERRVALAVGSGSSNKAVARELVVSIKTVEFHLGNVYRKLGLASRTELASLVGRSAASVGSASDVIGNRNTADLRQTLIDLHVTTIGRQICQSDRRCVVNQLKLRLPFVQFVFR